MSYTILYRSMYVRLSDGRYIPTIESGDNNVWEAGNKRRARDWFNARFLSTNGKTILSEDEIRSGVEDYINSVKSSYVGKVKPDYDGGDGTTTYTDEEIEKRFGYFGAIAVYGRSTFTTTAQHIRSFFMKGIERSVPIEEIGVMLNWNGIAGEERRYPNSEAELLEAVKEGEASGHVVWVGFTWPYSQVENHWRYRTSWRCRKTDTAKKEYSKGYVVTCDTRYIAKVTSVRLFMDAYIDCAHVYVSRRSAEKTQKRVPRNYTSEILEVEKVNGRWESVKR